MSETNKLDELQHLPWRCPDHPDAMIRHSWDQTHYVLNGYPAGEGMRSNHRYECAECGRQLADEKAKEE